MPIITTLINQKTHIIYGVIIVLIASLAYHFFKKDPEKIITTVTKTDVKIQTVEKIVTKDRIVYRDRHIVTVTTKANGDIITRTEDNKEHSITKTKDKARTTIKEKQTETKQVVETFMKNYSIEVMFPILNNSFAPNTNPLDTQVSFGTRIFSTPLWLVAGSTFHFNQFFIGVRYEF